MTDIKKVDTSNFGASRKKFEIIPHGEIFKKLLQNIEKVDFRAVAGLDEDERLKTKHFVVIAVDNIISTAIKNNWQICLNNGFVYVYNGSFWQVTDSSILQSFFGDCAEKMSINSIDARYHAFRKELEKQFTATGYLATPEPGQGVTLINLLNGTFEITDRHQLLRAPAPADFIKYQLSFGYDSKARAPKWQAFLDRVQPDFDVQMLLQEYIGYIFTNTLNLETVLLLYGSGANGKSVFIDIISAMLGSDNVSFYSLESITKTDSYTRANLQNKLLNCANEISGKLQSDTFKQLASGQPIEARAIYKEPFTMKNYAKFLFSCNELPREVEQTHGFFRRWQVVPFAQTIPKHEQNTNLAKEIISEELAGVFNWALAGLKRILINRRFTVAEAIELQNKEFRNHSDSVATFINEYAYKPSTTGFIELKLMYAHYKEYCGDCGFRPVGRTKFGERLRSSGFEIDRKMSGNVVYAEKNIF